MLERTFSRKQLLKFQEEYSVKLSGGGKDGADTRGLLVIKNTRKTKARQRKGAITNWKVSTTSTIMLPKYRRFDNFTECTCR